MSFFSNLFGASTPAVAYKTLVAEGAMILDVRSEEEFRGGAIKGAVNIPLDKLGKNLEKLDMEQHIIVHCASGMRSASAVSLMKSKGFTKVYNAGGINQLAGKL